jgi:hypothetical protein
MEACTEALRVFGAGGTFARLPITVPFDDTGMVVLSSAPPQPDAPRVPAWLEIGRSEDRFNLALSRQDGGPFLIPGVLDADGNVAEPVRLSFLVTAKGMTVSGTGPDARPFDLRFGETTARALAVALLITIGVKLTKAGRR